LDAGAPVAQGLVPTTSFGLSMNSDMWDNSFSSPRVGIAFGSSFKGLFGFADCYARLLEAVFPIIVILPTFSIVVF
jgi:hypothetical protein